MAKPSYQSNSKSTPQGSAPSTTQSSFFWHDYETFGVVPRRARPSQFAGIRTDADLNEIGAPVMLHCQPAPDFLPEPQSVLITGILPQRCMELGVPEHKFAAIVEAELAKDGTIGVGYNSIRFDDEITRFMFWRNLIDPYAREWQNGCSRWDVLDVVRCCWSLRPTGIQWPTYQEGELAGRPSFKLEHLTVANGIGHEAAHDALSDVRATVALARLIKTAQPKLWDFCLKLRKKDAVLSEIGMGRPFVHLSGMYPVERGFLAVVWPLAQHPTNKNEVIVWDLSQDPRELLKLDADTVRRRMFTRQADLPEGELRLPIKTIHINKSPIVMGNLNVLGDAAQRWQLNVEAALVNAEHAATLGRSLDGLWQQVFVRLDDGGTAPDVDEDLYGGFVGNEDRRQLQRLLELTPAQLANKRPNFADPRLDELLFRYRARNFESTLTDAERQAWQQHRAARLHEGTAGSLSLSKLFEEIDTLAETADERGQTLLAALYDYAESIAPDVD
jgi:exodeoxyribonuclease I